MMNSPEKEYKMQYKYELRDTRGITKTRNYRTARAAHRAADKLDNEFGAVRYIVVPVPGAAPASAPGVQLVGGRDYIGRDADTGCA